MKLKDLRLPKQLNLDILAELLPEEALGSLIYKFKNKSLQERRITLPSLSCLRKCLIHYLVEKHEGNFSAVMRELRDEESVLASDGHYSSNIKRLYENRKREIENEKRGSLSFP